jgi:hypothetical protein
VSGAAIDSGVVIEVEDMAGMLGAGMLPVKRIVRDTIIRFSN